MRRAHPALQASLAVLMICGQASSAWASAWTVPKNRWYVEHFYRYFGTRSNFDKDGESVRRANNGIFRDIRNELKIDYGVTDWFNLLIAVPYQSSHSRDDTSDTLTTGIGDIWLRSKFRWKEKPWVGAVQFSWKIPSAYNPNESPPLGDGQVDFESRVMFSRGWTFAPYEVAVRRDPPHEASDATQDMAAPDTDPSPLQPSLRGQIINSEMQRLEARAMEGGESLLTWLDERTMASAEAASTIETPHLTGALQEATHVALLEDVDQQLLDEIDEGFDVETHYAGIAFVNFEAAFTARNEEPSNEFPLFFEAGVTPFRRLMLVSSIEAVISADSTGEDVENFVKWGLRAIFNVWGDGFASVFRAGKSTVNFEIGYNDIFAGRNTADAFEVFAKLGAHF